jgi:hypothetical protein
MRETDLLLEGKISKTTFGADLIRWAATYLDTFYNVNRGQFRRHVIRSSSARHLLVIGWHSDPLTLFFRKTTKALLFFKAKLFFVIFEMP